MRLSVRKRLRQRQEESNPAVSDPFLDEVLPHAVCRAHAQEALTIIEGQFDPLRWTLRPACPTPDTLTVDPVEQSFQARHTGKAKLGSAPPEQRPQAEPALAGQLLDSGNIAITGDPQLLLLLSRRRELPRCRDPHDGRVLIRLPLLKQAASMFTHAIGPRPLGAGGGFHCCRPIPFGSDFRRQPRHICLQAGQVFFRFSARRTRGSRALGHPISTSSRPTSAWAATSSRTAFQAVDIRGIIDSAPPCPLKPL